MGRRVDLSLPQRNRACRFRRDDAEVFMTEVATNGDRTIDYIAGKLSTYARSS
jgi:hypothetical protein